MPYQKSMNAASVRLCLQTHHPDEILDWRTLSTSGSVSEWNCKNGDVSGRIANRATFHGLVGGEMVSGKEYVSPFMCTMSSA
jgi:hypothetical protein